MLTIQMSPKDRRRISAFLLNVILPCLRDNVLFLISEERFLFTLIVPSTTLLKSIRPYFFLQKPGGFKWSALAWGDLEPPYAYVNFFHLSIVSVDGKQHLSKVVFSTLVRFLLSERLEQGTWFRLFWRCLLISEE